MTEPPLIIEKRALARALFEEATGHAPSGDWGPLPEKQLDTLIKCFRGMIAGDRRVIATLLETTRKARNATMQNRSAHTYAELAARKKGPVLVFEGAVGGRWQTLAMQVLGDPPATIFHNHDGIRDVYVTQIFQEYATISCLPLGIDIEQGAHRMIDPEQVKLARVLHTLRPGAFVELIVWPDRAPAPKTVRYRFEGKLN